MKKTLFFSLVTAALIFSGCGGGGGDNPTQDNNPGGTQGNNPGGTSKTFKDYVYPQGTLDNSIQITIGTDGNWTLNPNGTIAFAGKSAAGMSYNDAVKWCSDNNYTFPGPNDLLALPNNHGVTSAWAKDRYAVNYTDNSIGQVANEESEIKIAVCLTKNSTTIDKKHKYQDINISARKDLVTGLLWTPFIIFDENLNDPGHANQSRFPISGATSPQLNAEAYCQTFGSDWHLPSLSELRSAVYFDGETLADYTAIGKKPTVLWTSTPAGTGKHYVINLNTDFTGHATHGIEKDTSEFYVTCVKRP